MSRTQTHKEAAGIVEIPHLASYRGPHVARAERVECGVKITDIGYYDEEITLTDEQLRQLGYVPALELL